MVPDKWAWAVECAVALEWVAWAAQVCKAAVSRKWVAPEWVGAVQWIPECKAVLECSATVQWAAAKCKIAVSFVQCPVARVVTIKARGRALD
jgi:hypothetical protein